MRNRRVLLYFAWSRPAETGAPFAVIDDRFPTIFELRRLFYPKFERLSDRDRVDQGIAGEWLQVDLGTAMRVDALQINFADQDSKGRGISRDVYKYVSTGRQMDMPGRRKSMPARMRYIRIRNVHAPDGGKFSLYDLRVFGKGLSHRKSAFPPAYAIPGTDARPRFPGNRPAMLNSMSCAWAYVPIS